MNNILEVENLTKTYAEFALREVTLSLPRGYILAVIGPNGAGKTTLIKLLLNLLPRDSGTIRVAGLEVTENEVAVKSRIGFVHDTPRFYDYLRLDSFKRMIAGFYADWDETHFQRLASEFQLPLGRRIRVLSRGQRVKFALALALAHHPEFLVMDEPTTGLDPVFRREFLEHLQELIQDERRSVFFSTQITSDVERIADYVAYLQKGRMLFSLPRDDLREQWAVVKGGRELLDAEFRDLFRAVDPGEHSVTALTDNAVAVRRRLPRALVEHASLEDIMVLLDPVARAEEKDQSVG